MAEKRSGFEGGSRRFGVVIASLDRTLAPARKTGGGFEFRRKLSSVGNPYCDIATYVFPDFPEQASSARTADDRSVIVIDASTLKSEPGLCPLPDGA